MVVEASKPPALVSKPSTWDTSRGLWAFNEVDEWDQKSHALVHRQLGDLRAILHMAVALWKN